MGEVQVAARTLGLEVATLEIRRAEDIAPAFEALKGPAEALYLCLDPLVTTNRVRIITLAQGAQLVAVHVADEVVNELRSRLLGRVHAVSPQLFEDNRPISVRWMRS